MAEVHVAVNSCEEKKKEKTVIMRTENLRNHHRLTDKNMHTFVKVLNLLHLVCICSPNNHKIRLQ